MLVLAAGCGRSLEFADPAGWTLTVSDDTGWVVGIRAAEPPKPDEIQGDPGLTALRTAEPSSLKLVWSSHPCPIVVAVELRHDGDSLAISMDETFRSGPTAGPECKEQRAVQRQVEVKFDRDVSGLAVSTSRVGWPDR